MNSVASEPALIGIDWGTSSLRAFLIGARGEVLDQQSAALGILQVPDRDFETAFEGLLAPWALRSGLPVIASGMISSRNGWIETPYIPAPAGRAELAGALTLHSPRSGHALYFVTGMTTEQAGAPDVMRGEETQIVGALAGAQANGRFVLPGTHSKWIDVRNGQITGFATYMTGELFAALRGHTILGTLMQAADFSEQGFRMGVQAGQVGGHSLLRSLFHVRSLPLFGRIPPEAVADYLSGMLIGAEIQAAQSDRASPLAVAGAGGKPVEETGKEVGDGSITIICRDDLAERYEIAFEVFGLTCQRAPSDIVARGHFEIATSAGVI